MSRAKRNTRTFYLLQHLVRCAECGMLFGGRATKQNTVRRNGKVYRYDLDSPRRYYQCYGMQRGRSRCREHPFIRAERLEDLVWSEVKKVVQNPEVIVTGIDSLKAQEDGGVAEEIAKAERDLRDAQAEEDRAIRLYVVGKITEGQLDHQRRFITEKLEHCRVRLDGYRAQEAAGAQRRVLMGKVGDWAEKVGQRLDVLSSEERRDVLLLLLDHVTVDRDDSVNITLAIPTGDLVAIENPTTSCWSAR